jgi:hypothetical protein
MNIGSNFARISEDLYKQISNSLGHSFCCMHTLLNITKAMHFVRRVDVCVSYDSRKKFKSSTNYLVFVTGKKCFLSEEGTGLVHFN